MKTKKVLKLLRDAATSATLKTAQFGSVCADQEPLRSAPVKFNDGRIVTESNVTEFIRERVRLYHKSWIIGRIESAIEEIQSMVPHKFEGVKYYCTKCGKSAEHRSHKT